MVIVTITALIILILTLIHEGCMLRLLRWLGCFRLVCLEFLASFHLHGAVDNPVGSQRLQPLHFHDHHLGSTDITATCCRTGVIHPLKEVTEQKKLKSRQCCWQILPDLHNIDISATVKIHIHLELVL